MTLLLDRSISLGEYFYRLVNANINNVLQDQLDDDFKTEYAIRDESKSDYIYGDEVKLKSAQTNRVAIDGNVNLHLHSLLLTNKTKVVSSRTSCQLVLSLAKA